MSSIFTENASNQEQTQIEQQASQQTDQPPMSFVEKLVQAKGENWKDPEVLAKGKLEADNYIQQLEEQNRQLREDLGKNDYAAQVLEEIRGKAADTSTAKTSKAVKENIAGVEEEGTPPSLNEDDLKSLVEKTLLERETKKSVEQNLKSVEETLRSQYGDKLGEALQNKASELGLSMGRMEELASESPSAFLALFGDNRQNNNSFSSMMNSSINTEGVNMQSSTERNWSYYQKIRRENPNQYYSPKIQQQLMRDKMKMGDRFGN